jgi:isopentenyl-diphosphate Delta-isomerase
MDEMVDIVDEELNVLTSKLKSEAHKKGLLHATVIAGVRDSKGRIILVKQSSNRQDPGQFVSPVGGHVKSGETMEEALLREAEEEIGTKEFSYKFIGKAIFNREVLNRIENHYFIVYEIILDTLPALGDEADSFEYFTENDLKTKLKSNPKMFGDAYHFVVRHFVVRTFYSHLLQ